MKDNIEIKVCGKDIKRFLLKLHNLNINIINVRYENFKEGYFVIPKKDYKTILKQKGIYDIQIVSYYGKSCYLQLLQKHKFMILAILLAYGLLICLSQLIFRVTVVHTDRSLITFLEETLADYGIRPYAFQKNYTELRAITTKILKDNKDKLEWLEIEVVGTTYRILVQERLLNPKEEETTPRHIVAKKAGVLKKIETSAGITVKNLNTYVDKDEIIVTGLIPNPNGDIKVRADANIYAEVWYTVNVTQPLVYKEEYKTGKQKQNLCITALSKEFCLFPKYQDFKRESKLILQNHILPFSFLQTREEELHVVDEVYTFDEAVELAILQGRKKIEANLGEKEYIISEKVLKKNEKNSTIEVEVFYKVYENITGEMEIVEEETENR